MRVPYGVREHQASALVEHPRVQRLCVDGLEPWPPVLADVVDNLRRVRYVEVGSELQRRLCVPKMSQSEGDSSVRRFSISSQGVDVAETFESAAPRRKKVGKRPARRSESVRRRSRP